MREQYRWKTLSRFVHFPTRPANPKIPEPATLSSVPTASPQRALELLKCPIQKIPLLQL